MGIPADKTAERGALQLGGQPPRQQNLADLVNFIRNNIGLFQQWAESDTAKLYTPPVFVNKKEAQGYFF